MSSRSTLFLWGLVVIGALILAAPARATVLVYEPFQGYAAGALNGQTPNAIGIDNTVNWANLGPAGGIENLTTGLTFGSLVTAGGAEYMTSSTAITSTRLTAKVGTVDSVSGTLYNSYLVSMSAEAPISAAQAMANMRFGDTSATTPANARYYTAADRTIPSTFAYGKNTAGPNLNYNGAANDVPCGANRIAPNTTYMVLARYTNVGSDPSVANPAVGTLWILTQAQFETFVASGHNDAYLDAATVGTAAYNVFDEVTSIATAPYSASGKNMFQAGNFFQMLMLGNATDVEAGTFDELRYATTVADATPTTTPEPGTLALLATGIVGLLAYAWRKRK
jgi:hypothetical protein